MERIELREMPGKGNWPDFNQMAQQIQEVCSRYVGEVAGYTSKAEMRMIGGSFDAPLLQGGKKFSIFYIPEGIECDGSNVIFNVERYGSVDTTRDAGVIPRPFRINTFNGYLMDGELIIGRPLHEHGRFSPDDITGRLLSEVRTGQ